MNDDKKIDQWFYSTNEEDRIGPITLEELIALLAKDSITFDTLVWNSSLKDWQRLKETPEIITNYSTPQPPPLPKHEKTKSPEETTSSQRDSFATSEEEVFGDKPKREPIKEMGMNVGWLNFYTYIRIPFTIILSIAYVIHVLMLGNLPYFFLIVFFTAIEMCFLVFLFIGLHKRKRWGWWLNWLSLVGEILIGPLAKAKDPAEYYVTVFFMLLVWLLPNTIYFMKRYKLFKNRNLPNQQVDPIVTTPVDEVEPQSTQGHP